MDQVSWWRLWVMSGLMTLFVAFGCCLWLSHATRYELARAVERIKSEYAGLHARLDQLSARMDAVEEQLLRIILHLFPEDTT